MTMGMSLAPRLELLLECTICHQHMRSKRKMDETREALLFGAAPYALCIGCFQKVDKETMEDPFYRARYRRRLRSHGLTLKHWKGLLGS